VSIAGALHNSRRRFLFLLKGEILRLFIAIPIPVDISRNLGNIILNLKKTGADIKWVKPESIHITLKFLGETDEEKLFEITSAIESLGIKKAGLGVEVKGIGFFPDKKRPRVVWAGLEENAPFLIELASKLDSAMSTLGFEREKRRFSPHLTIGRFRSNRGLSTLIEETEKMLNTSFGSFPITEFNLYSSTLKPSGAEYKVLRSFKL
jgi:2'-5' RNA ligase